VLAISSPSPRSGGDADDRQSRRSGLDMTAVALVALAAIAAAARLRPHHRRSLPGCRREPSRSIARVIARALQRRRHHTPNARAVAAWCDDIARSLRSGSTLRQAALVLPLDLATEQATSMLRLRVERGLSLAEAVDRVDADGPHLQLALGVIGSVSRIGGPSAAAIDRTATVLRQRAADDEERAAHAAQARLSAHVMTALPLLMLAVLAATDDDVRSAATSPIGAVCITGGLVLNAIGWWWMRHIVRGSS
jgi:tight adherence protein B